MKTLMTVSALALLALPAFAQDEYSYEANQQATETESYQQAEDAAASNTYETDEGNAEFSGNVFDGTPTTGEYQDTDTLEPSYGIVITPNE